MIPELAIAMLACTRIGAIHSIVFGGFSSKSMAERVDDCQARLLVTSDGSIRKGKAIPIKDSVDEVISGCRSIKKIIVVKRAGNDIKMRSGRDLWWHEEIKKASDKFEPVHIDSEDPVFILYTSGTTGKPKGVLHATGGYSVYIYI